MNDYKRYHWPYENSRLIQNQSVNVFFVTHTIPSLEKRSKASPLCSSAELFRRLGRLKANALQNREYANLRIHQSTIFWAQQTGEILCRFEKQKLAHARQPRVSFHGKSCYTTDGRTLNLFTMIRVCSQHCASLCPCRTPAKTCREVINRSPSSKPVHKWWRIDLKVLNLPAPQLYRKLTISSFW